MEKLIRIGTGQSPLAEKQAQIVLEQVRKIEPEMEYEIVTIGGDDFGLFEEALLDGEIDMAVHGAENMPIELRKGLSIIGTPVREDARDVLITRKGGLNWDEREIVIATSGERRKLQLKETDLASTLECLRYIEMCGDIEERLKKLMDFQYDGLLLGSACLKQLGIKENEEVDFHYFNCHEFVPAAGQGIIAVEGRLGDDVSRIVGRISHADTALCLVVERKILSLMEAGNSEPIGVHAVVHDNEIHISILFGIHDKIEKVYGHGPKMEAMYLCQQLLEELYERFY